MNYPNMESYQPQIDCCSQPSDALDPHQEAPHPQLDTEVITPQGQDASPEDAPLETRHAKKRRAAKLSTAQLLQVPPSHILPRHGQPRRTFDPAALTDLTASIKTCGVLQPVLVCPLTTGQLAEAREADRLSGQNLSVDAKYQIVAGERRWRASLAAGLAQIPILLDKNVGDDTAAEIALVENLQREDLPPLDTADALAQMQQMQGYSLRKLAVRLGKSKGWLEQYLALARLPGDLRELVSGRPDTLTHVRELEKVADPALRAELIARVVDKKNPLTLVALRHRIHQSEAKEATSAEATSAEADAAPTTGELEITGDPATAGEIAAEACQENLPSAEQDDAQSAEEDTADDCDAEAPGDLDFLEDEHSGLDYSSQAALYQGAVSAQLHSLTQAVNKLQRPVHPAALTRMIQAIQETQAALAQALARWQAEPC